MKFTAPSCLPCSNVKSTVPAAAGASLTRLAVCCVLLALAGCQTTKKASYQAPPPAPRPAPGFACTTNAQEIICSNETLTRLDQQLAAAYHEKLQRSDSIGREHLIADQKRWLIARAQTCQASTLRLDTGVSAAPGLTACLARIYGERIEVLKQWPPLPNAAAAPGVKPTPHPLSAYVELRPAEYLEPQSCAALAEAFNGALRSHGALAPGRIPGVTALGGTHDGTSAASASEKFSVDLYDAGPYAGYALRARALKLGAERVVLDASALGSWIRRLPNHGGRPNTAASQTGDYGSIDVFQHAGRTLALVAEPWGKYAAGAQGEWAYAGLYQIAGSGLPEPLCLYRTYMTPPLRNEIERLPAVNALQQQLALLEAPAADELVGRDLHDDHLFGLERQWQYWNMPLLALGEARRNGWSQWLRLRHDAVLNALFSWSERSLRNKQTYRRLLAQMPAAAAELAAAYQRTQRLTADDARAAAEMTLQRMLAQAASDLPGYAVTLPNTPNAASASQYRAKYPILASEADLQRDRSYTGLYSAALNGADKEVIDDYLKYEAADPQRRQTRGTDGETPLMAAVESPEIVRQLLAAGAKANETDALGRTALMNAAAAGQIESVRLLIGAGAQIAARDRSSGAASASQNACQRIRTDLRAADKATLQNLLCPAGTMAAR